MQLDVPTLPLCRTLEPGMALYELVLLRDGELVDKVSRVCADDLDALEAARAFCGDHAVELYCDGKLIARVKHGDEALNARDLHSG